MKTDNWFPVWCFGNWRVFGGDRLYFLLVLGQLNSCISILGWYLQYYCSFGVSWNFYHKLNQFHITNIGIVNKKLISN